MSGFAGVVGPALGPVELEWLDQAAAFMAFRGPDACGTWHDERAGLCHTLLTTLPEERGSSQPVSLEREVWIAGDVRLDARAELVRKLRSSSRDVSNALPDVELVLHAYHVWGEGCLQHLAGDFAFAVWDRRRARLFCARDQFGVAQFFYARVGSHLLFGNTLESLLLHQDLSAELNEAEVADYLALATSTDASATMFSAIHRLPPAHSLSWSGSRAELRRYWSVPEPKDFVRYSRPQEYGEHFRELFTTAVADRLRTDRVSVQLSGGLDSTSVAAVANHCLSSAGTPYAMHALTVDLGDVMPGETAMAAEVASSLGIQPDVLVAASYDVLDPLLPPDWLPAAPSPFGDTALRHDMGVRTAQNARVAFTGMGGDPLLLFLPSYWLQWLQKAQLDRLAGAMWHEIRLFRRVPRPRLRAVLQGRRAHQAYIRLAHPPWLAASFVRRADLENRTCTFRSGPSSKRIAAAGMAESPTWSSFFQQCDPGLTGLPLRFRHPFFDIRLLDYVLALPPAPWLLGKQILRDAMRGLLPESVRMRRKAIAVRNPAQDPAPRARLVSLMLPLVDQVAELDRFIDRGRLRAALQDAGNGVPLGYQDLCRSLSFARWLHHWRRPELRLKDLVLSGNARSDSLAVALS